MDDMSNPRTAWACRCGPPIVGADPADLNEEPRRHVTYSEGRSEPCVPRGGDGCETMHPAGRLKPASAEYRLEPRKTEPLVLVPSAY
ncbi:hypothetical protein GCM10009735_85140 [Actinomadura chokoriensis]